MTDQTSDPCPGFPDRCPNLVDVPADQDDPPRHDGGVRCGCSDPIFLDGTALTGKITMTNTDIQAVQIAPPPTISMQASNGRMLWAIHPDGRMEFSDEYQPDEAAQAFWDAVQRWAPGPMVQQYGAPLTARINAHLKAGQEAEQRVAAITEAAILWRDRPGGDVGLAIALAGILDTEQPVPPAAAALVRVLRECDRIERAVRAQPTNPDFDGAYLSCLGHIRKAAGEGGTEESGR